ncbi:MAG: TspO/MBR family protein [Candidatus Zixiibacteriota bacterium]
MEATRSLEILKLAASIIVCQLAGFVGSIFTASSVSTWYRTLRKPSFTPPDWIFSPVWITLFVLMGVSAFLVWRKGLHLPEVKRARIIFCVQLAFNVLWSIAFFGGKSPLAGLVMIAFLWLAILFTILSFLKLSSLAGLLLVPYLLWVSFAARLNLAIWNLNR